MQDIIYKANPKARTKSMALIFVAITFSTTVLLAIRKIDLTTLPLIFLVIVGVVLLVKKMQNKDTVIVNKDGIYSHTNGMGLVAWHFIDGFAIKKIMNGKCLVIHLNDERTFLSEKKKAAQKLMRTNIKKLGSPAIIPYALFDKEMEAVVAELERYRAQMGKG